MRTTVASLLIALSLAVFGFVAMKWIPVIWKDGLAEAYDQLASSRLNITATASLIVVGIISFGAGVLAAPDKKLASAS